MAEDTPILKTIFAAATQVFVREGYDAATMTQIAKEADISRTSLNYYFRTKERLFLAIHEASSTEFSPKLRAVIEAPGSILEKIPRLVESHLHWLHLNSQLPLLSSRNSRGITQQMRRHLRMDFAYKSGFFLLMHQYRDEVGAGKLRNVSFLHALTIFLGLTAFPFMAQQTLRTEWLRGDTAAFDAFIDAQIPLVVDAMTHLLAPRGGKARA